MATDDSDFRIRPGRSRSRGTRVNPRTQSFLTQVKVAVRKAGGNPNRISRSAGGRGREEQRPVQREGPGRRDGADAEGSERVEPGRERGAHTGATGGGEGPRGEAQPAARSCPRAAVCRRQGGGRASALPRAGRRYEGWREGPSLFGRARRGGWPRFPGPGPR